MSIHPRRAPPNALACNSTPSLQPYNELDHQRPASMNETEYVSQMLTKVKRFAQVRPGAGHAACRLVQAERRGRHAALLSTYINTDMLPSTSRLGARALTSSSPCCPPQTTGVHVWFVAHPRQLREWKGQPPNLYDISGSAHFINKVRCGSKQLLACCRVGGKVRLHLQFWATQHC